MDFRSIGFGCIVDSFLFFQLQKDQNYITTNPELDNVVRWHDDGRAWSIRIVFF